MISAEAAESIRNILGWETSEDNQGYPLISLEAYQIFQEKIPHLYEDGHRLLEWCTEAKPGSVHLQRTLQVIKQVTKSASICASANLWALMHVLASHARTGILEQWQCLDLIDLEDFARKHGLSLPRLSADADFLCALKLWDKLRDAPQHFRPAISSGLVRMVQEFVLLETTTEIYEPVAELVEACRGHRQSAFEGFQWHPNLARYLNWLTENVRPKSSVGSEKHEVELREGFLAFVILMAASELGTMKPVAGAPIERVLTPLKRAMSLLGICDEEERWTEIGARSVANAGGPLGIIYSYRNYFRTLANALRGCHVGCQVIRHENLRASQKSHSKTLARVNDMIDAFCQHRGFHMHLFIEHAMGYATAIEDRFQRSGERLIQYFAADLDFAAVECAIERQRSGVLPSNMRFVCPCDISSPSTLISQISHAGFSTKGAVMVVGNGFHEVSCSSSEMVSLMKEYCDAGIILVIVEESLLDNEQLRASGWNTYHGVFRYVHNLSGQRLRPYSNLPSSSIGLSWHGCLTAAGYEVLNAFSFQSRSIVPCYGSPEVNVPISACYFCVPEDQATSGDVEESSIMQGK